MIKFVRGEPNPELLPPRFRDDNEQCLTTPEGGSAVLKAELHELGRNTEISWSKDGAPVAPDRRRRLHISGNTVQLALDSIQSNDAGIYRVTAISPTGTSSRDIELRVSDSALENQPPAFLRRLHDLSVKVGTRTRFLVEIRSSSDISIKWLKNDQNVSEGERYRFVNEGGFHCVDVAPVTTEDSGKWVCQAQNLAGLSSSGCHLNVLVPKSYKSPEFIEELKAILTDQGTVTLECKVVGVPTPLLRWFKDGKEIRPGDVFALTVDPNEDPTSLGTYLCEATNCIGTATSSSRVHVLEHSADKSRMTGSPVPSGPPPIFKRDLENEEIKIGDPLRLSCQVSVPPWPKSMAWYNSQGKIDEQSLNSRYKCLADGLGGYIMEVRPTEAEDQGEWKAVATSEEGAISISTCDIKMIIPKHFKKPRFLDTLKAVLTEEGLVSFECKVVGSPTPLLRWFKDGQELRPGDVYQLTGTNSLGSYCCIAKNCMGEARSSAELTVEDIESQLSDEERAQLLSASQAPKFLQGLKSVEAKINETFRFSVHVSVTTPLPTLAWYRDDQPIDNEPDKYFMHQENLGVYHLDIRQLEFNDQAEWKCVATNEFGHSVTSSFLRLTIPKHYKKPKFLECLRAVLSEEGAVNLECKVIGVPQPILKWYKDGVELKPGDIHRITSGEDGTCCLGTYTCEARNCMGVVASSASLLGFEEQRAKQQERAELARQPSLSTIHEERTSQLYDTAGDQSLTLGTGEVSFSFDGKEVSVSLYETPDLTEDEALQIVEMYAEQLSEHVSEHNIVELPPLRFIKESSTSGNLLMEAVVVDVSDDYFVTADDDLRTEADVEEIYSITDEAGQASVTSEQLKIDVTSSSGDAPRRPPRKTDSQQSNSYYTLSKNMSTDSNNESLAGAAELDSESYGDFESAVSSERHQLEEERAFQVAAITETSSLPDEDHASEARRPLTPRTTHEIGSDLRVNLTEEPKQFSHIFEEPIQADVIRDLQGEEGDGLVIDLESREAKENELKLEESRIITELMETLNNVQTRLLQVEEDIVAQSALKSSSAAADRSLDVLKSISQPIRDVQTVFESLEQKHSLLDQEISIVEMLAPPVFDLQKSLGVVEKCVAMKGKEHTLIQKTCSAILENTSEQLHQSLDNVEKITLLEKELDRSKSSGRITPSKIIQEVCITIREIKVELHKAIQIMRNGRGGLLASSGSEPSSSAKDLDVLSKFLAPTLQVKENLESLERCVAYAEEDENYGQLCEAILEKLSEPIKNLVKETKVAEKQAIRYADEKSVAQELRLAILDKISNPVGELSRGLNVIKTQQPGDRHAGVICLNVLETFASAIEDVITALTRIQANVASPEPSSHHQEVFEDVFEQVSQIVHADTSQAVSDLLLNIETAQRSLGDAALLEALRQLATLHKDLTALVEKIAERKTEATVSALEHLGRVINTLNSFVIDLTPHSGAGVLRESISALKTLETSLASTPDETLQEAFSELKEKVHSIRESMTELALSEPEGAYADNVVVVLEEASETVVPELLLEDTRKTLMQLQNLTSEPAAWVVLEPLLPSAIALYEITNEALLKKLKDDLTEEDRGRLQYCVTPLELIEDRVIESLDALLITAASPQRSELKTLLEHVQYNVAVMHQQVMDELHFPDERRDSGLDDLKKSITSIQNLPVMCQANFISTSESKKILMENVAQLERSLGQLYETAMSQGMDQIPPELFHVASEVTQCVEKIKPLIEDNITLEDAAEIQTLCEPLKKLSTTIETIENDEEVRRDAFIAIREPLIRIAEVLERVPEDLKIRLFNLHQPLQNAIEIITLEQHNFDIQIQDLEQLRLIGEAAGLLAQSMEEPNISNFLRIISRLTQHSRNLLKILDSIEILSLTDVVYSVREFAEAVRLICEEHKHEETILEEEVKLNSIQPLQETLVALRDARDLPERQVLLTDALELLKAVDKTSGSLTEEDAVPLDNAIGRLDQALMAVLQNHLKERAIPDEQLQLSMGNLLTVDTSKLPPLLRIPVQRAVATLTKTLSETLAKPRNLDRLRRRVGSISVTHPLSELLQQLLNILEEQISRSEAEIIIDNHLKAIVEQIVVQPEEGEAVMKLVDAALNPQCPKAVESILQNIRGTLERMERKERQVRRVEKVQAYVVELEQEVELPVVESINHFLERALLESSSENMEVVLDTVEELTQNIAEAHGNIVFMKNQLEKARETLDKVSIDPGLLPEIKALSSSITQSLTYSYMADTSEIQRCLQFLETSKVQHPLVAILEETLEKLNLQPLQSEQEKILVENFLCGLSEALVNQHELTANPPLPSMQPLLETFQNFRAKDEIEKLEKAQKAEASRIKEQIEERVKELTSCIAEDLVKNQVDEGSFQALASNLHEYQQSCDVMLSNEDRDIILDSRYLLQIAIKAFVNKEKLDLEDVMNVVESKLENKQSTVGAISKNILETCRRIVEYLEKAQSSEGLKGLEKRVAEETIQETEATCSIASVNPEESLRIEATIERQVKELTSLIVEDLTKDSMEPGSLDALKSNLQEYQQSCQALLNKEEREIIKESRNLLEKASKAFITKQELHIESEIKSVESKLEDKQTTVVVILKNILETCRRVAGYLAETNGPEHLKDSEERVVEAVFQEAEAEPSIASVDLEESSKIEATIKRQVEELTLVIVEDLAKDSMELGSLDALDRHLQEYQQSCQVLLNDEEKEIVKESRSLLEMASKAFISKEQLHIEPEIKSIERKLDQKQNAVITVSKNILETCRKVAEYLRKTDGFEYLESSEERKYIQKNF
ncbi:uncharacterized protein [Euwallacea similis]|uniref:uncharacterized protein n=1 Tax=Euwallacea similis TaxID=1736056 RepID=UPI00344DE7E5